MTQKKYCTFSNERYEMKPYMLNKVGTKFQYKFNYDKDKNRVSGKESEKL